MADPQIIDAQERYVVLQFCKENLADYSPDQVEAYRAALLAVASAIASIQEKDMSVENKYKTVKHSLALMIQATQVKLQDH